MEKAYTKECKDDDSTQFLEVKRVHPLKRLALARASHYGKIALSGSRRLRSIMLAAAPGLFAQARLLLQ